LFSGQIHEYVERSNNVQLETLAALGYVIRHTHIHIIVLHFCSPATQADDSELPANRKELQFNISSRLEPSDRLVALELLIKLPETSTTSLQGSNISLYEFTFGSSTPELLETHPIISPTSHRYQEWLGFNVRCSDTPARENYRLQIEITGQRLPPDSELSSLLDSLKIRLITFTYDNQTMENLGLPALTEEHTTVKRQASATLQTLGAQECSKHAFDATYQQLGWPGSDVTVIAPNPPNFKFCHGHCRSPYGGNREIYTRHAEIIAALKAYNRRSDIPSPCCVPTQLNPMSLIYERGGIISMTCFQDVGTCGCV